VTAGQNSAANQRGTTGLAIAWLRATFDIHNAGLADFLLSFNSGPVVVTGVGPASCMPID
jgi:hypothetical protein